MKFENEIDQNTVVIRQLQKQVDDLNDDLSSAKKQLNESSTNGLKNIEQIKSEYADELEQLKTTNSSLTEDLQKAVDRHKSEVSELRKREALLM